MDTSNIDLKKQPTLTCEKCDSMYFKEVTLIKKVSKLLLGTPNDTLVPFPTYMCNDCGHVNEDFRLFDENNKTNLIS
jgi:uncharacterized Zn finger protein